MDERMKSEITVLQEISSAIVHERNADALLNKVLDVLNRRMGMLRGTFTLLQGDTLTIEASQGLDENERQLGRYHIGEGITGHVAETGRPHLIPDIRRDSRFLNRTKSRDSKEPVAFICVPIIHLEQVVGTLSIDRRIAPDTDLENDMALLEIIGNITAEAVSVAQKEHEERENLLEENRKLRRMLAENPGEMVGNCRAMQQVYELVRQVAPSDATVLIRGSSGTGKELVARAIVNLSPRREKPFVCLNCAALPENLVESELFGHEKGAFTGATGRRIGRAEAADGGTLFLDEIGDLSLQTQVKLLRFIQERTFSRVGSNAELRSNVRFLAATSRNLEAQHLPDLDAGSVEAQERHHSAGRAFHREDECEVRQKGFPALDSGDQHADGLSLARQRPRARELHRTGGADRAGRMHPRLQSAAFAADRQGVRHRASAGRQGVVQHSGGFLRARADRRGAEAELRQHVGRGARSRTLAAGDSL